MSRLRLGILISGGGTTFLNLHQKIQAGELSAEIACVVSSSSKAAGLHKARQLGYPGYFVGRRKWPSHLAFSNAIDQHLGHHRVDLVVLGGFLKKYLPGAQFDGRCINIHPSLIPSFCGAGFYGMRVHEAVWRRSCKITGCTVHLVNENYDEGPIILQKAVAVHHEDTASGYSEKSICPGVRGPSASHQLFCGEPHPVQRGPRHYF